MQHPDSAPQTVQLGPVHHTVDIRFTGTGSEYFRIWIVNMLLLLVTLGLYWPWAKVRRLRYFWGNTLIDGDPLGFHGDSWQMFKGWALVGALFGLYNWASNFSPVAGLLAFVVLAALWPALWRSSMRFRMANTSWRGLRFRFVGSVHDAYATVLPSFLIGLPFLLLALFKGREGGVPQASWVGGSVLLTLLMVAVAAPWVLWRMKLYQHRNYALGTLRTDFRAELKAFYLLSVKPLLLVLGVLAAFALLLGAAFFSTSDMRAALKPLVRWAPFLLLPIWGLMMFGLWPWFTTRMQNLVWTKTGNAQLRFDSRLSFRRMFVLSLKNGALIAITLGLYWPFAAVAKARLRLEAVHIRSVTDLHDLLAAANDDPQEAAGEAAGDFFGLDVGL